jgi:Zn-dependent peptidase ImmA (M78 family)
MTTLQIDLARLSPAESLLWRRYGVTRPDEIDLDAIAADQGLIIRRRALDGADARLVAVNDHGIITVNSAGHSKRQRFSIGHELGHWFRDRHDEGLISCTKADASPANQMARTRESEANVFSADLILPPYLVRSDVGGRPPTIDLIVDVSEAYAASIPAAAIRVVRLATCPAAVAVHGVTGREWCFENVAWPTGDFYISREVHHESPTMSLLFRGSPGTKTRDQKERGDRWLVGKDAYRIDVHVQSIKRQENTVLTVIRFSSGS